MRRIVNKLAPPFCHFFCWQETKESSKRGLFVFVLFAAHLAGFSYNSGMRVHGWYQLYQYQLLLPLTQIFPVQFIFTKFRFLTGFFIDFVFRRAYFFSFKTLDSFPLVDKINQYGL